jgi:hypothetical protein
VTIKGVDEADNLRGDVSWVSPIARALIKARVGDEVQLMTPGGLETLEVLAVVTEARLRLASLSHLREGRVRSASSKRQRRAGGAGLRRATSAVRLACASLTPCAARSQGLPQNSLRSFVAALKQLRQVRSRSASFARAALPPALLGASHARRTRTAGLLSTRQASPSLSRQPAG